MWYWYFFDFWHGIPVFANFSYGIFVLGTPNVPPSMALISNFVTFFKSTDPYMGWSVTSIGKYVMKYTQPTFKVLGD